MRPRGIGRVDGTAGGTGAGRLSERPDAMSIPYEIGGGGGGLRKRACKPSSVPLRTRIYTRLGGLRPHVHGGDSHLSSPGVADGVERPTRGLVGRRVPLFGLAPDGVCPDPRCYHRGGELLPRHFTLIPNARDGMFLWHFPSGCPAPLLAGILARWCSDFPPFRRIGTAAARPSCARPL